MRKLGIVLAGLFALGLIGSLFGDDQTQITTKSKETQVVTSEEKLTPSVPTTTVPLVSKKKLKAALAMTNIKTDDVEGKPGIEPRRVLLTSIEMDSFCTLEKKRVVTLIFDSGFSISAKNGCSSIHLSSMSMALDTTYSLEAETLNETTMQVSGNGMT